MREFKTGSRMRLTGLPESRCLTFRAIWVAFWKGGKRVRGHSYIHVSLLPEQPELDDTINEAIKEIKRQKRYNDVEASLLQKKLNNDVGASVLQKKLKQAT